MLGSGEKHYSRTGVLDGGERNVIDEGGKEREKKKIRDFNLGFFNIWWRVKKREEM